MTTNTQQQAAPRTRGPRQRMGLLTTMRIEEVIGADHLIRGLWKATGALDWSGYLSRLRARGSRPGRAALHPQVLATLWLYGLSQGVDSARELARRCRTDLAYLWALGGESVNHHTLSDFLRQEPGLLEDLLSQTIWVLRKNGVASFDALLVDGTRVDARASAESFQSEGELRRGLGSHLSRLRTGAACRSGALAKERAARERAAREAVARHEAAAEMLRARQAKLRAEGSSREARAAAMKASATDAESRFMRRSDGGSRVSVNLQVGCCAQSGAVLYAGATDQGNDAGLGLAAALGMRRLCGALPSQVLADGGYQDMRGASALRELGVAFLSPLRPKAAHPRRRTCLRLARPAEDWQRQLWATRGAWARRIRMRVERVIGSLKRRGMRRVPVFGLAGARGWALWHALAHNVLLGLGIRG